MAKTQKELAYLTDLYIQPEWTQRFTELADKYIDLSESENLLYINPGTGTHALIIDEKHGEHLSVFASCQNEDLLSIARDKGAAVGSGADFSCIRFEDDSFDAVIADATLVSPRDIPDVIENALRVSRTGGDIGILLLSASSFGEVFSLLWEAMMETDPDGVEVTRLISDIPTIEAVEAMARQAEMVNIHTESVLEVFEFETGAEFVESPLIEDFLMPIWLDTMDEDEQDQVRDTIKRLIDDEDAILPFRFSVKATLLTGEKA